MRLERNHTVESYHVIRTNREWLTILGMGSRSEACGNHHGQRSMDEVKSANDLNAHHARTYRSVCMRTKYLAQERPDILFVAQEIAIGHTENGAEIRDTTSS